MSQPLFRLWGGIDLGRSLSRVAWIATILMLVFACAYSHWPQMLLIEGGIPEHFT